MGHTIGYLYILQPYKQHLLQVKCITVTYNLKTARQYPAKINPVHKCELHNTLIESCNYQNTLVQYFYIEFFIGYWNQNRAGFLSWPFLFYISITLPMHKENCHSIFPVTDRQLSNFEVWCRNKKYNEAFS